MRRLLLKISALVSPVLGKIHAPYTRKKLKAKDYRECKSLMKNGMILLTSTRGELTTLFIPGQFSHVAMIVNQNTVIEATGEGVHTTDLIDFILSRDYAVLLKPIWLNEAELDQASKIALQFEGFKYDYYFSASTEQFYCSELAYMAFKEVNPESPIELRNRLGQDTFIPQDFWEAKGKFEVVWMSESLKEKNLSR